jgi:transcriptional regulator with XRE-family HTH domain
MGEGGLVVDGLGKLIVARRKELGYSQQDLARMIGVPAANLSQLEHSPSRWRSRLIPALADALGVSQLELVMAARVISDLPPFPSPNNVDDFEDSLLSLISGNGHLTREDAQERLRRLVDDLTLDETEFLLAVAETFPKRYPDHQPDSDRPTAAAMNASFSGTIESAG